jgi:putative hydrolase of the HAD superfamily
MIRAVLFDLDGTLLNRETSFRNFVTSQYAKFETELRHIPREIYVPRVVALDNRGTLWKDKVYQAIVEEFSVSGLTWQELFEDFDSRITDFYVPFPHLRETLDMLKASGYLLGLISNGRGTFQMRSIKALSIEKDFGTILISETVGLRKPDPEIFWQALRNLNCEPHHSVYIGDDPVADIGGACKAGMKTAWKKNRSYTGVLETNAIFEDLAELPSIVRNL